MYDLVFENGRYSISTNLKLNYEFYNPETHELVEKKEAKINRLNKEIDENTSEIEAIQETIVELSKKKSELIKQNKEKEEGLKQLK